MMIGKQKSKAVSLAVITLLALSWGLYLVYPWTEYAADNVFLRLPKDHQRLNTPIDGSLVVDTQERTVEEDDQRTDIDGSFVIKNPGCSILRYPTFSKGVRPFLDTGKPAVNCIAGDKGKGYNISRAPIESNATHVFLAHPFTAESCCYHIIRREIHEDSHYADNFYSTSRNCQEFPANPGLKIEEEKLEFLKVVCHVSHDNVTEKFVDLHATPVIKEAVERRCEERSDLLKPKERKERLNMVILGLDATSRLNFHRQMPQTREYLEEIGAVELYGYNKVADNTFPNIVPLMTGLTERELRKQCWRKAYEKLDNCPWIWRKFVERGYRTLILEDAPNIGIFNFERMGFRDQPSDYYLRPFMLAAERDIAHFNYPTVLLCLGQRLAIEVILGYTSKFSEAFLSRSANPSFSFIWSTTMTHDGLALTKEADPILARELRRILSPQARENTAFLFISDHGVRTGDFRQTAQGSQEERLPFAFLVLPSSFRGKFPKAIENLKINGRERLTTPFDLHYTLLDLIDPSSSLSPESLAKRTESLVSTPPLPRGISLFLPVPDTRTCTQAGITNHWCTCVDGSDKRWAQGEQGQAVDEKEAHKAGESLVLSINKVLSNSMEAAGICAHLQLEKVLEARTTGDSFIIRLRTLPGGAVFEGTMNKGSEDGTLSLDIGSAEESLGISRLNRYGNQSACITDYHLKIFCYCLDELSLKGHPTVESTLKNS